MQASIIEISAEKGKLEYLAELDLASIPTEGDKIVYDIENTGYVFKVIDVHYANDKRVDVMVARICTITEYNATAYGQA